MSLTPEQAAAALELARTWPAGFASANDTNDLARAVLHFAEQYEYGIKIRKQIAATLDARDRAFDEALGLLGTIRAERDALKADVARLQAAVADRWRSEDDWIGRFEPEITRALAATAPPESAQGAQPGEAPERGSAG